MAYRHTMNDPAKEERLAFSTRLKVAMASAHVDVRPSVLAREFNRRARGMEVTSHAARKWLVGEAVPTQQRLLILADWLDVRVAWLRFGTREAGQPADILPPEIASDEQLLLLREISCLSEQAQALVRDLVDSLQKLEAVAGPNRQRGKVR